MKVRKQINVALQGGGALGAFTWGVLDYLLEDDAFEIVAISGASAGAMNGVVLCDGLVAGGEEGARAALRRFWEGVADAGAQNPFRRTPLQKLMLSSLGPFSAVLTAPWQIWTGALASAASPYDFNPMNLNPIQDLLEELVNFERVRQCQQLRLFVAATNVETGKVRIFTNSEMTARHITASACLPQLFQAVEIDGQHYWDGGYMGNPPLFPLFDEPRSRDIVIVQINPLQRPGVPKTTEEIDLRINEVTFNASLLRELRAIEFVARLLDEGRLEPGRYRKMLLHTINDDADLLELGPGAKLNTDMAFFEQLFVFGRRSAEQWRERHFSAIGNESTVDLRAMFAAELGPAGPAS